MRLKKLECSMLSVLNSTRRRGGKNWWGSSPSISLHILVVCIPAIWFKGTSTKVSSSTLEEGGLVIFSFNFPFPLEAFFCLPPSTYVPAKLTRVESWKIAWCSPSMKCPRWCCLLDIKVLTALEEMGSRPILKQVLWNIMSLTLLVMPNLQEIGELINGTME